ncbi:MAG: hypothetical protein AAB227_05210 [Pseudomonadota bacterium]
MAAVRIIFGYAAAAIVGVVLASAFHTQMVIAALGAAGAAVPFDRRLAMTGDDLIGLLPQFGAVIAIALAIGFLVAAGLRRVLKPLAGIAYPLAGAAAIGVALTAMSMAFDGITPIAGARSTLGFGLQCLAGALGGLVFSTIAVRPK